MIRVEHDGALAFVVIDRADRRNALMPEMLVAMRDRAAEAAKTARVLVLRGEGAVFCSGFDLKLCREHPDGSVMRALLTNLGAVIGALRALPIPVVVAAHGAAIAGGCALLGGADVAVADRGAKLGYPVVKIGVSPAVSAPFLRLGTGDGAARARLLEPELISGEEAARVGLVHALVDRPADVLPRAIEIARDLAGKPPHTIAATKAWLNEIDGAGAFAARGLDVSLGLAGGEEERERLERAIRP
ncbi:MAG: enoyl-CoA hydratase/isomerase family protein [Phycisphaerales bacterium]